MAAALGRPADAVAFLSALAEAPYRYDFYQVLRRLECLYDDKPRWGEAQRPVDEAVRLGQAPDLSFAPASLAAFDRGEDGTAPRLQVRLFGLLGPNGPLPLHMTEYVRERLRSGDPTLNWFIDLLQHRFLTFFYRAWAQAQPHVNRDRIDSDRFATYIGAFFGLAPMACRHRDVLPDAAKFFHVGALIPQVRHAGGLAAILQHFFRVPVQIEQWVGHWLPLPTRERTGLAREGAILGAGAVLGGRVWDRQHKFRIELGPLTRDQYEWFLPGSFGLTQLVDWVRLYYCLELDWDVRLRLRKSEVPRLTLGRVGRLGWTTWLGTRQADTDAADLCLHAETFMARAAGETA